MIYRFNTLVRLFLVAFLVVPVPVLLAEEVTTTENFNNQQINQDIQFLYGSSDTAVTAINNGSCGETTTAGSIFLEDLDCFGSEYFGSDRYQLGIRSSTDDLTIVFPSSDEKEIREVGFTYNARESEGSGTVYYALSLIHI